MISHNVLENEVHELKFHQPLHRQTAPIAMQLFRDLSQQGVKKVIVNLEEVPFIDSHGLAALVVGMKIFDDGHNLRLVAPQMQPRLLFEVTMFDRVFQFANNVDEAARVM
jgi:anti-anti-sigma factor